MILYLDSSALLRLVLREAGAPDEVRSAEALVSSELLAVECLEEAVVRRDAVASWLEAVDLVLLQRSVLSRASEPLPVPLGTLDASTSPPLSSGGSKPGRTS